MPTKKLKPSLRAQDDIHEIAMTRGTVEVYTQYMGTHGTNRHYQIFAVVMDNQGKTVVRNYTRTICDALGLKINIQGPGIPVRYVADVDNVPEYLKGRLQIMLRGVTDAYANDVPITVRPL